MGDNHFTIRLAARNEGIKYEDETGVYRFRVELVDRTWTLYLPGSKGPEYERHELSDGEEARILPRITQFLGKIWYFGFFPRKYDVLVERTAPKA